MMVVTDMAESQSNLAKPMQLALASMEEVNACKLMISAENTVQL